MKPHLVTLATADMSESLSICIRSAIYKGGISPNQVHRYSEWDIRYFKDEHPQLFVNGKGYGYWSWKPYLINSLIEPAGFIYGVSEGDIIVYADAGIEFINNVHHIIDCMDQDIFLFGNNWEHAHWCKGDVLYELWRDARMKSIAEFGEREGFDLDVSQYVPPPSRVLTEDEMRILWLRYGKQVQASVIFFRISDYSRRFVKEWLDWCLFEGGRLIDDSPSRTPNHPEFREHRHDQAILTTMAYRDGLKLHYWPAMYNDGAFTYEKLPEYAGDDYPVLFHHHRRRNHEWGQVA